MVAPAEDAFVCAGQRGGGFHAAVALNAIEGVLVAAAPPTQHALCPAAQLHATVRPCKAMAKHSQQLLAMQSFVASENPAVESLL